LEKSAPSTFVDNYGGTGKQNRGSAFAFSNLLVNWLGMHRGCQATNIAPPPQPSESNRCSGAIAKNPALTPLEIMQNYLHGPAFQLGGRSSLGTPQKASWAISTNRYRLGHHPQQIPHRKKKIQAKAAFIVPEILTQVEQSR